MNANLRVWLGARHMLSIASCSLSKLGTHTLGIEKPTTAKWKTPNVRRLVQRVSKWWNNNNSGATHDFADWRRQIKILCRNKTWRHGGRQFDCRFAIIIIIIAAVFVVASALTLFIWTCLRPQRTYKIQMKTLSAHVCTLHSGRERAVRQTAATLFYGGLPFRNAIRIISNAHSSDCFFILILFLIPHHHLLLVHSFFHFAIYCDGKRYNRPQPSWLDRYIIHVLMKIGRRRCIISHSHSWTSWDQKPRTLSS